MKCNVTATWSQCQIPCYCQVKWLSQKHLCICPQHWEAKDKKPQSRPQRMHANNWLTAALCSSQASPKGPTFEMTLFKAYLIVCIHMAHCTSLTSKRSSPEWNTRSTCIRYHSRTCPKLEADWSTPAHLESFSVLYGCPCTEILSLI